MTTGQTSVLVTATQILPAQGGRTRAVVINNSGGHPVYVGNDYSVSSSTGFLIANGTTEAVNLDANRPLIGIATGGTSVISWSWAGAGDVGPAGPTGPQGVQGPPASPQGINPQTDSYTLVAEDAGQLVTLTKATAVTLTVPPNASVAFVVGTIIDLAQLGAGQVTVAGVGPPTIHGHPGLKLAAQYAKGRLQQYATDVWLLSGDLSA